MRIAISTGGGDAPGLNAVIRAAVLSAINRGWDVLGIKKGFAGLMGDDECVTLTRESVRGIAHLGGTILHTTNRGNPFHYPIRQPDGSFLEVASRWIHRVAQRTRGYRGRDSDSGNPVRHTEDLRKDRGPRPRRPAFLDRRGRRRCVSTRRPRV